MKFNESTNQTNNAQLAIFIRAINDKLVATTVELLLNLFPMHGYATAKDICQHLSVLLTLTPLFVMTYMPLYHD